MRRICLLLLALALVAALPSARAADADRLVEHTFDTPLLRQPATVRVLLPEGYDPARDYPVLYLLHGGVGSYRDWVDAGQAAELTAPYDLIVVMPDAGQGGWYSDWHNQGRGGPPMWETFHIRELIPWVDATFSTIPSREGRAVAGLSMGGFGAMSYAARHPDLFVAAASFSGAVDTNLGNTTAAPGFDLVSDATASQDGGIPTSIWGPRATEDIRWRAHNPWDLAENLRGVQLTVRTGNGRPGNGYSFDPIEYACHEMSVSFHERLDALGIEHLWDDYGQGGHTWDLWARGLGQTLPRFMAAFADPPPAPDAVTFTAVEPAYSVYGWDVTLDRPVLEWSRLEGADAGGFTLVGSGAATVVTPPSYAPGSEHPVTIGGVTRGLRADGAGRLHIDVPLGPSTPFQERTAPALATDQVLPRTTSVAVAIG